MLARAALPARLLHQLRDRPRRQPENADQCAEQPQVAGGLEAGGTQAAKIAPRPGIWKAPERFRPPAAGSPPIGASFAQRVSG